MGMTPTFTQSDVKKRFDAALEVIRKWQIKYLQHLGELCVTHARQVPAEIGFTDQTGNLRSSIGYVVFVDGVAVHDNYVPVYGGSEGVEKGKALAKKVGSSYKDGICLVVTAGMNYAIHVESKGRDVLTSAEQLAKQELPKILSELSNNISKATK